MANPDQKTILLEQAYGELKAIYTKLQAQSGDRYVSKNFTLRTWEGL